ncbi:uncharacterized protein CcaverHIS019_0404850 [Cutaneotrichosporon cavernicola]|uniref:Actin-related protein 8 n=1 Tax=Cutaneotrichosporon cavernicola TaxID=279322 RepID=A0AA48QVS8_9TREE|nr:uncharacterized protein CcaverHIS019_0404850 [Cutaneotrichosporon cavernicola]BEI91665.1 hypothetical protein CcaverHIS019_0404850 [Cutaneotrichosporon cavernicola]BEI99440.1 hypothetical protein CcaverHIS631_0404830 [Cutaneotrichosporon cavernicola]BEJ07218.1 hypothetical protein CcaverHIS641_0404870 [Cutaneotrichosporon cavernicola]
MDIADLTAPSSPAPEEPVAGPSAPAPRKPTRKAKPKAEHTTAYTTAFVPSLFNIRNPVGDFLQKESNVEVRRQIVLARRKEQEAEKEKVKDDEAKGDGEGEANGNGNGNGNEDGVVLTAKEEEEKRKEEQQTRLSRILVIHPGSRNLRLGRASDFYPHEVPNCIARAADAPGGHDPPVLGKRAADVDDNIGHLREYLRNKLRVNKLVTDARDGARVNAANAKAKPETIPEHNDPYRVDWTEVDGRPFVVGTEAQRLADSAGFRVRYPIHQRGFNGRDWDSLQLLIDDITLILQESLRTELDIRPKDYKNYSVVLVVPDFGNRVYVERMTDVILNIMGFKEIAIHQESYCAIFSAGMSSACVVDIGAQTSSVTLVEEGVVNPDTRMRLSYGGDDVTVALSALLQRASFPYKNLDLARTQDWIMMDNLKIKLATLEEHLVANTPWDLYVVPEKGLTNKYLLRTYDENVLAPLCWFDTRMIDFETKREVSFTAVNPNVSDMIKSPYGEPTVAMRACTTHLLPSAPEIKDAVSTGSTPAPQATAPVSPLGKSGPPTPAPGEKSATPAPATLAPATAMQSMAATPAPDAEGDDTPSFDVVFEASKTPLDGAIAASISAASSENRVRTAASSILLVGGGSALKGLAPFIADRLPALLRQRGYPIDHVSIVPPPRGLNPRFMSWKGASVMCNLNLPDMWIGRDEVEELGARMLKDHLSFL